MAGTRSHTEDREARLMSEHLPRKWTVLIAIGISTFMSALDGSIVNTLLPLLGR